MSVRNHWNHPFLWNYWNNFGGDWNFGVFLVEKEKKPITKRVILDF